MKRLVWSSVFVAFALIAGAPGNAQPEASRPDALQPAVSDPDERAEQTGESSDIPATTAATTDATVGAGDNAIVVTGKRLPDKAVNRYIYDMLRPQSVGQSGQYPRLYKAFCPSVLGFGKKANKAIAARMKSVAKAAGIEIDKSRKCKPNVHVVGVEDGPEMIRFLRERRARSAFGQMPLWQRDLIERRGGPVYAWQQVASFDPDTGNTFVNSQGGATGTVEDQLNVNFVYQSPRLRAPARSAFRHSTVLIEGRALKGLSVIQLADYALMRGMVPAREDRFRDGARTADSILNLFDPAVAPDDRMLSLGRMDFALLTTLYAAPGNVSANRQRGRMVKNFRAVLSALD